MTLFGRFLGRLSAAALRLHVVGYMRRRLSWHTRGQYVPKRTVESLARLVAFQLAGSVDEALPLIPVRGTVSHV